MARTARRRARAARPSRPDKKTTSPARRGIRRRHARPAIQRAPPRIGIPTPPRARPSPATPASEPAAGTVFLRWGIPLLLFSVAVLVYADDLELPAGMVFDEAHYVRTGQAYANGQLVNASWGDPRPFNFEHPPLAKYLIGVSIWLLGDDETGWRFPSVLVGASGVAGMYVLASRLFGSSITGLVAAAFLLFEPLYFLHARMSMLDVFPAAFTIWAFALGLSQRPAQRALGGLFLGLALASKYHAAFLIPAWILLHALRSAPGPLPRRLAPALLLGVALPVAVLLLSYLPYYVIWYERGGVSLLLQEFILVQVAALAWDFAANATHEYASTPLAWIALIKPVWYYVGTHPDGRISMVYSVPNPALWWLGFVTALLLPLDWMGRSWKTGAWRRLTWTRLSSLPQRTFHFTQGRAELFACLLVFGSYLPWFLLQRISFLYYATYTVPFLGLLLAGLAGAAWQRGGTSRRYALALLGAVAAFFLVWYPLASGAWMTKDHYSLLRYVVPWMLTAGAP